MATTNDSTLAKKMRLLRSHGITRDTEEMTHAPDGPWYYQQIALGYNYRMTDIQAALGASQMRRLDEFVNRRRFLAQRYNGKLKQSPVITPTHCPHGSPGWHLYVIRLELNKIKKNRLEIFNALRASGIGVNLHYTPVYLQPYYEKLGFSAGYCTEAEQYYAEAISLPMYPGLTENQQDLVISALASAISA